MSVAVYPRLGAVLEARNMTVPDLDREIKDRLGLKVSLKTLYELALAQEPIHRVDIAVAGAAASVLDVTLNELFAVRTTPNGTSVEVNGHILDAKESRRLEELLDRQGRATLSQSEQTELEDLIATYGERLHEQSVREIAHERGVPIEQVRREAEVAVAEAVDWLRDFEADPLRRQAVAEQVKQRRAIQAE